MKAMLEKCIAKSRLSSCFINHTIKDKDDDTKKLYISFLQVITEYVGITDKMNEFMCKLQNTAQLAGYRNQFDTDSLIKGIEGLDKGIQLFLLVDAFILLSFAEDKEFSIQILKEVFKYLDYEQRDVDKIISIARYILENSTSDDYLNYHEVVKSIITDRYIVNNQQTISEDKIFLNCTIKCYAELVIESENIRFINCELLSPYMHVRVRNSIKAELKDCIIKTGLGKKAYIGFSNIHSLSITGNTIYEVPDFNINFEMITHYEEKNNKEKYLSKTADIQLRG